MWPFRRRSGGDSEQGIPGVSGLAEFARANGWEVRGERPFDGHLEDGVTRVSNVVHRVPANTGLAGLLVSPPVYRDAYRLGVDGRTVIVSNAWMNIQSSRFDPNHWHGVSVCAAELPSMLLLARISPRSTGAALGVAPSPTGNPEFDEKFIVSGPPEAGHDVLTPPVQEKIMARDDWFFWAERYLFGCITPGGFTSVDDVRGLIDAVLGIIAAIPESVVPARVDHSADDVIARFSKLTSMQDAMTALQNLTPADREQLANSDSPLAVFADVRSPQEAMARFQTLNSQQKMQLFAMYQQVKDAQR